MRLSTTGSFYRHRPRARHEHRLASYRLHLFRTEPVQSISPALLAGLRHGSGGGLAGDWSLTTLKDKLIKIGAKVVSHGRYVIFQMAEVAIARQMFEEILRLIAELRPQPPPALA